MVKRKRKEQLRELLQTARTQKRFKAQVFVKTEERSAFDEQCISSNFVKVECEPVQEACTSASLIKSEESDSTSKNEAEEEEARQISSSVVTLQLPTELHGLYQTYSTPEVLSHFCNSTIKELGGRIEKPHFDIITYKYCGIALKRLVIYKYDDPSLCVEFNFLPRENVYRCNACFKQGYKVTAKIIEQPELIVIHEDAEHLCCYGKRRSPQFTFTNAVLRLPDAKLSDVKEKNGTYSLFVYTSGDQKLCYKYKFNKCSNKYFCIECKKKSKRVTAMVYFDSNDDYFAELDDQKHVCRPIIEDKKIILDPSKFKHFVNCSTLKLIVYCTDERKHAYELTPFHKNSYYCFPCLKLSGKKLIYAKLLPEIVFVSIPHICQPRLIGSSVFNGITSGAAIESCLTTNKVIIDSTMFEMKTYNNNTLRRIFVFCNEDQSLCYELAPLSPKSSYYCVKCNEINFLKRPCVNLRQNSNGEYYLEVLVRSHVCEPSPYSPDYLDKTLHPPHYTIYNRDSTNPKEQRVIVFASDDKRTFYEFLWLSNRWRCQNCSRLKHCVNVTRITSDNGMEYLMFGKNSSHICEPQIDFAGIYSRDL